MGEELRARLFDRRAGYGDMELVIDPESLFHITRYILSALNHMTSIQEEEYLPRLGKPLVLEPSVHLPCQSNLRIPTLTQEL